MSLAATETVGDGDGLRAEGCQRDSREAVSKLVGVGAPDARVKRKPVRANGSNCSDGRRALGGNLGPLES